MIARNELRRLAQARLQDARVLFAADRYDSAIYLSGYALEFALKARICMTLQWLGYPNTSREFQAYRSFRTHNLEVLLSLSGREPDILLRHPRAWSTAATWAPEMRYNPVGLATQANAQLMLEAIETLLSTL